MQKQRIKSLNYSYTQENVVLSKDFPVFIFSHSATDEQLSNLHSHNTLEVGLCLKGNGVFIIDNRIYNYQKGDMTIINSGLYHRAKSSSDKDDLWYFMFYSPRDWSLDEPLNHAPHLIHQNEELEIYHILKILMEEIFSAQEGYREIVENLLRAFTLRISRLNKDHLNRNPNAYRTRLNEFDERIIKTMDLMISRGNRQFSIQELAEYSCLSESHFRHMFKEQVGIGPKQFQTNLKIMTAMNLLKNNKFKIVDISYECGFQSLSSFNRQFKMETGSSPLQWRLKHISESES